ncbi:hypothetical protein KU41_12275 [Clostridium botulinum]|nr:hypothetical protein KU40_17985 [Clostridium botulinum]KFX57183.1 hypothetical protein KU41_12275 [Clostridium botulinum]KON14009.1 hypothetical protein ACP50_08140 [Clostridium botulinum]MBY6779964.1 hypothetical protein [Clostridium botulinum]NFI86160.1 hypothetical protein [Clostridium botulinum]
MKKISRYFWELYYDFLDFSLWISLKKRRFLLGKLFYDTKIGIGCEKRWRRCEGFGEVFYEGTLTVHLKLSNYLIKINMKT